MHCGITPKQYRKLKNLFTTFLNAIKATKLQSDFVAFNFIDIIKISNYKTYLITSNLKFLNSS
jgi:hypothetical protein